MDTLYIDRALRSDPEASRAYINTMARDEFVSEFRGELDSLRVFNTHPSSKPGEHWIIVACGKDGVVSYFDSFGLHPAFYPDVYETLLAHVDKINISWNDTMLQSALTNTCGDYCVLFGLLWARGWDIKRFVHTLSQFTSKHKRDHYVRALIIETFEPLSKSFVGEGIDRVHIQGVRVLQFLQSLVGVMKDP